MSHLGWKGTQSRNCPLHPPLGPISLPVTRGHTNQTDMQAPLPATKHTVLCKPYLPKHLPGLGLSGPALSTESLPAWSPTQA